ncbi:MAG TPA: M50 family metallopeptidase [Limnochordia bacterium]|nr:M50 family metallopeptidase [Limnochordia bacterium]
MNPFFILLLVWAAFWGRLGEALLLLAIVLWHETCHVLAAAVYKLPVTDIELLPFGGVARLEAFLQLNPKAEWIVAAAGPLGNLFLVGAAYGLAPYLAIDAYWFRFFVQANAGMALFNLLPCLPLDGGRVLRSLLVRTQGFAQATRAAARLGQACSVLLLGWGVYNVLYKRYNFVLVLFAGVMLFAAARQELTNASYVFMRYLTARRQQLRLARVCAVKHLAATSESSLGEVLRSFQPPSYHLIWVVDLDGKVAGFLGELEVISALFEHGLSCKLGTLTMQQLS